LKRHLKDGEDIELHFASENQEDQNSAVIITFQSSMPAYRGIINGQTTTPTNNNNNIKWPAEHLLPKENIRHYTIRAYILMTFKLVTMTKMKN